MYCIFVALGYSLGYLKYLLILLKLIRISDTNTDVFNNNSNDPLSIYQHHVYRLHRTGCLMDRCRLVIVLWCFYPSKFFSKFEMTNVKNKTKDKQHISHKKNSAVFQTEKQFQYYCTFSQCKSLLGSSDLENICWIFWNLFLTW